MGVSCSGGGDTEIQGTGTRAAAGAEAGHDKGKLKAGDLGSACWWRTEMEARPLPPPPPPPPSFYKSVGQLKSLQKPKSHRCLVAKFLPELDPICR